jgi:hypothetical protein
MGVLIDLARAQGASPWALGGVGFLLEELLDALVAGEGGGAEQFFGAGLVTCQEVGLGQPEEGVEVAAARLLEVQVGELDEGGGVEA